VGEGKAMTTEALAVGTFDADTTSMQRRRVGWSSFLGTVIEYYDFTLYGLLGPVVFDKIFFPHTDPMVGTLVVLSVYAVGFIGRPLGGLFFSHYGDKIGRKPMMVAAMTVMGLASTAMGLLPSYQSVGFVAPVLLVVLRIVQGFALGGESAGANVLSTEVGPDGRRGHYVSLVTSGIFLAWILALCASTAVSLLAPEQLLAWGWRLPFIASLLLVAVAIWMRLKIEESAVFVKAIRAKPAAKVPFLELLRDAKRPTLIVLFAAMAESTTGFYYLVFGFTYALRTLHIPVTTLLTAMLIANIMALILAPVFGSLSDRFGRRAILSAAYAFSAVYAAFLFFPLLQSGSTPLIYLAMIIPIGIGAPWAIGVIGSFYPEQFADARLRYSGVGFGRGLGTSLGGGLMPLVAASLMAVTNGSQIGPIVWFTIICIGAIIAILLARETKDETLG
jgi:MFS family permease